MFDIDFFMKVKPLKDKIVQGAFVPADGEELIGEFERLRSSRPYVFNVETTNHCNMRCVMCPRTALMTRKLDIMDFDLFLDIISQIKPIPQDRIEAFNSFVKTTYGLEADHRHEDAFYFYVVATHLILHGYGEPLLDPHIVSRVAACTQRRIPTYFSCVPANIKLDQISALMDAGLGILKFSLDGLTDDEQQSIRGARCNFEEAHRRILEVIELKERHGYATRIVIQRIELSSDDGPAGSNERFREIWKNQPVFAYVKSQDNRWYYENDSTIENRSHYERQYCEYPFSSLTVMADGSVVPCTQDYNAEMTLGNAGRASLADIWNSQEYSQLRARHITGAFPPHYKCTRRCDQKLVCDRITGLVHA